MANGVISAEAPAARALLPAGRAAGWVLALLSIPWLLLFVVSDFVRDPIAQPLWIAVYVGTLPVIYRRARAGDFFDPWVLLTSAYLFLLVIGSLVFDYLRAREFGSYPSNLVGAGYTALIIGMILGGVPVFRTRPPAEALPTMRSGLAVRGLAALGLIAALAMFARLGTLPILAADVNAAKVQLLAGSGLFNVLFTGLAIALLALVYDAVASGDTARERRVHALAVITAVALFSTGFRARTLIFVGTYLATLRILRPRPIARSLMLAAFFGFVLFLGGVGAFRRGTLSVQGTIAELGVVTVARPAIFDLIVRRFDGSEPIGAGAYLEGLAVLLPGQQERANVELKYALFPNADKMPELAGITPGIVGEAYMYVGDAGVVLVMVLVGFVSASMYRAARGRPTFLRIALFVTFVFALAGGMQSGIGVKVVHLTIQWLWVGIVAMLYEWRVRV